MPKPRESKSVCLDMTGEEFKTLIERTTDNGKIDTVPELMETAENIPSIVEEKVRDAIGDSFATDEDIENLFGNERGKPDSL